MIRQIRIMTDNTERSLSPCIRNCCLNQNDVCLGCFRTLSDIIAWGQASNDERKVILVNAKKRVKEASNTHYWILNETWITTM